MVNNSTILDDLNDQQRSAVLHTTGPAMVLAGAGSGKTRVLTSRVAWLMTELGVAAHQIMLVTFTNKAAQEMNKRIKNVSNISLPFSGTFHSLAAKIIRIDGYEMGISPNYLIYDTDDQLKIIKQIYKDHNLDPKQYKPQAVKGTISTAKNELISSQMYQDLARGSYQQFVAKVYSWYQQILKKQNALDFDDLLLATVKLLEHSEDIRHKYQQRAEFLLIDEYQDTNTVQYKLTSLLSQPQNNLFVVGDFAQSIYAWRGADYRNMLQLKIDFPDIKEYRLEQNYRSTQTILDAATGVISQTSEHPILELWTEKTFDHSITSIETESSEDEANQVLKTITTELSNYEYQDIAILYRTNAQSRPFEEACIRFGIPYQLIGGFKFYERKEIKDLLAYLRIIINPQDSVSLERILSNGKRRWQEFEEWLVKKGWSKDGIESTLVIESAEKLSEKPPFELLTHIIEVTDYQKKFDQHDPEDIARLENITELLNVATQFTSSQQFLENIALVQDTAMSDVVEDTNKKGITLMSLHSAKGLEFPVVLLVGMEEGLLPHSRSLLDPKQLEEERRLCYVGITRAKERLFLTYTRKRWGYGKTTYSTRSRFINDIPKKLIEHKQSKSLVQNSYYEDSFSGHSQNNLGFDLNKIPPKQTSTKVRKIISDDQLDALLNNDLDIDAFLEDT